MTLRVLHVSQPVHAGVAAVAVGLVRAQRELGWEASVACPGGWLADEARELGAVVHPWSAGRSPDAAVPVETWRLRRIIADATPDVVHLHSAKAGLAGRLALRGGLPTIYQPHAWSFEAVTGAVRGLSRRWERTAARWTHQLICVSDDELCAGRAIGIRGAAVVIRNGVDTGRWLPRDRAAARQRLDLPPNRPLAVCVGRLTEQKGQDLLLSAWPRVCADVPGAMLALVGDGPRAVQWRDRFPDARGDAVRWVGQADPADWYAASDVVVLPSRWEGMALVPLEAMSSARPVVGFDVAGVRESVGDAGALVPPADLAGLAAALRLRLAEPERAAAEGLRGRTRAEAEFDAAAATRRICEVTLDVAERPSTRRPRFTRSRTTATHQGD